MKAEIRLYNTLTRAKEALRTAKPDLPGTPAATTRHHPRTRRSGCRADPGTNAVHLDIRADTP